MKSSTRPAPTTQLTICTNHSGARSVMPSALRKITGKTRSTMNASPNPLAAAAITPKTSANAKYFRTGRTYG